MSGSTGIFTNVQGIVGGLLADLVNMVGGLLGGVTGQGNGAQVEVDNLASVSINTPGGSGSIAQVSATTSNGSAGGALAADVQGLLGSLVGGVVNDLGGVLGGLGGGQGSGFALSVGGLISIGINQTPAQASLLSLGINTSSAAGGVGSTSGLGGL